MKTEQWNKIEPILDKALDFEKSVKRREFIHNACEDEKLENHVLKMLSYIQKAKEEGFLE